MGRDREEERMRVTRPFVMGYNLRPQMPAFASVAWVREMHNQRLAYVALDCEGDDLRLLENRDVIIDGARFRVCRVAEILLEIA